MRAVSCLPVVPGDDDGNIKKTREVVPKRISIYISECARIEAKRECLSVLAFEKWLVLDAS